MSNRRTGVYFSTQSERWCSFISQTETSEVEKDPRIVSCSFRFIFLVIVINQIDDHFLFSIFFFFTIGLASAFILVLLVFALVTFAFTFVLLDPLLVSALYSSYVSKISEQKKKNQERKLRKIHRNWSRSLLQAYLSCE